GPRSFPAAQVVERRPPALDLDRLRVEGCDEPGEQGREGIVDDGVGVVRVAREGDRAAGAERLDVPEVAPPRRPEGEGPHGEEGRGGHPTPRRGWCKTGGHEPGRSLPASVG